jgi:hypothetical protein
MPRSRLALLLSLGSPVLLLRSMVLPLDRGHFLIPASVPLPTLAPEVLLKPAPVVLVVSLISGVPMGCVRGGRGIQGDLHGRALGVGSSYGHFAASNYGRDGWRNRYYGVYVDANAGSAYADDGCTYTYSYGRHTPVMACTTND